MVRQLTVERSYHLTSYSPTSRSSQKAEACITAMSAASVVGTNDELLRAILSNLTQEKYQLGPNTHSLERCAVVSRAFSEVALDLLWEELPGLVELVKMLPSFCRITSSSKHGALVVRTGGPIQDGEWSRFTFYADRVRTLQYYDGPSPRKFEAPLHPDVIAAIANHAAPHSPLPGLRSLRWTFCRTPLYLSAFVPASLRSLKMDYWILWDTTVAEMEGAWPAVQSLTSRCPELTRLQFHFRIPRSAAAGCIPLAITGPLPTTLKDISLKFNRDHSLKSIWDLPGEFFASLEALELDSEHLHSPDCQCPLSSTPASSNDFLRGVKTLSLSMAMVNTSAVLAAAKSQALERLKLTFPKWQDELATYGATLAPSLRRFSSTLRFLRVELDSCHGSYAVRYHNTLLKPWLAPLLALHRLEDIDLIIHHLTMYFSGDDLESMARAWPSLTRLHIRDEEASHGQRHVVHVPAASLLAFATHCPALETLELWPLYATESNSCDLENWSPSATSPCAPQLRQLTMYIRPCPGESRFGHRGGGCSDGTGLMKRFLRATFPNAEQRHLEHSCW
ncbi:hypothetical protein FKP32DRAFT_1470067 [Trametes sanguinea]|nr:hypothetical protein FKP32DRAFT_1470067 [Trametes sanguinea]